MFITNLEIKNFRGIKSGNLNFPLDTRMICMIGAGDSTKSTILKAIEWVFWPAWNLIASDNDFYRCDTSTPIVIRGTFTEIPEKLISEDKFGLYLRRPHVPIESGINDEPVNEKDLCLTVQLTIDNTLEPKWEVVCNRKEPRAISVSDRKTLVVASVGENCAKDLVWGKFSVLQKYANAKGILHDAHTMALREIANHADLHKLDDVSEIIISVGKQYGVGFDAEISNKMFIPNGSFSSSVGLFDGDMPLNQKGMGSKRLLSMGLNIQASAGNTLLLIDEVENGLEPYRLRSLLNEFRTKHDDAGQVIMTTHSPIAVAECTIGELIVVQSKGGETKVFPLKGDDEDANAIIQAEIRRNAESFLCKRLIVCEGKTEIGFIRALDTYLAKNKNYRMAFKGVGMADGGGSKIFACTDILRFCGYEVCLFMDSDLPEEDGQKNDLDLEGISVFDWDKPNALEEQIFFDVPTNVANQIIGIAVSEYGIDSVKSRLTDGNIPFEEVDEQIVFSGMKPEEQKKIGEIAKRKKVAWYKRIDLGELLGNVIFENWNSIGDESKLKSVVNALTKWVVGND